MISAKEAMFLDKNVRSARKEAEWLLDILDEMVREAATAGERSIDVHGVMRVYTFDGAGMVVDFATEMLTELGYLDVFVRFDYMDNEYAVELAWD